MTTKDYLDAYNKMVGMLADGTQEFVDSINEESPEAQIRAVGSIVGMLRMFGILREYAPQSTKMQLAMGRAAVYAMKLLEEECGAEFK